MITFSKQNELPSLPVPNLNETLDKYLKSVSVLLNDDQKKKTIEAVEEFRNSKLANTLQEALINRAKEKRNWLEDWWYDVYNEIREPIIPYLSLASINSLFKPLKDSQLCRAAEVTHYWMLFWKRIREETIPITRSRGVAWDMYQYYCLFNSTRVPSLPKDRIDRYFKTVSEGTCPSHIIVLCRGNIWKVEMLREGELRSANELYKIFMHIKNHSSPQEYSVVALTTEHRNIWAKHRFLIINHSKMNEENIKIVEESCFCIALTDNTYGSESELLKASLMGDSEHQWADKCVNLVFLTDGQILLQGDHSNVDAIVVMHAGDDAAMKSRKTLWEPEDVPFDIPIRLSFDLSTDNITGIIDAKKKFNLAKEMHRATSVKFTGYGNDLLRKAHLYSDTIVQIALQLAFLKTHGSFAPIYETASTRQFFHGRTETVRGCTQEMINFVEAVIDNRDLCTQRDLLKVAYNEHNNLMNDCMNGRGFDRHLLGLRNTLVELNKGCSPKHHTPKLFTDEAWKISGGDGNFLLSTSFIGYMLDDEIGGYGYVTAMRPDGYGIFYRIGRNVIQLTITDWKNTKSNLNAYERNICWALDHIGCLICESSNL